jgi:N-methylhydantoinase A
MTELLASDGVASSPTTLERHALMRYVGQSYDVSTPVPSGTLDAAAIEAVKAEFHRAHEREYGVSSESFGIAFVTLRVTGVGATQTLEPATLGAAIQAGADGDGAGPGSLKTRRAAYFGGTHHDVEVHDAARLAVDQVVRGPALIEQQDGVIVLPPGAVGRADDYENVLITTEEVPA